MFNPLKVGSVHLLVRHSTAPSRYWYFQVECRLQDSTCFCVLSAFPQELSILRSVLPYRVHNKALFHSVRFRQWKEGVTYGDWIVVDPQTSAPFAWEQPLLSGEIEVQLGLRRSIAGERWEEAFIATFDPPTTSQPPTVKRLRPLPGDETRAEQRLFVQTELFGPTRVLLISVHPSLEQSEEEILRAAKQKGGRRLSRREVNEALRRRQQRFLQQSIDLLDAQLLQLSVLQLKVEERAQGLASGLIERPDSVAPEDSALLVEVKGVKGEGLQEGTEVSVVVEFNGSKSRVGGQRVDRSGHAALPPGPQSTAAFRANNLRLSTPCHVTLLTQQGTGEVTLGHLDFTLFEYDDHQRRQQWLPLSSSAGTRPVNAALDLSVWWIPPAEEEVRRLLSNIRRVDVEWRRVKAAVKAELKRTVQGQLEGVVGSANTEVLFLVRVTGLTGMADLSKALPPVGGRLLVRVTSDLTNKVSSALLYHHPTNIQLALAPPPPPSASSGVVSGGDVGVTWGHTLPFLVSEDLLDARGGEVLHFDFVFAPNVSPSDSAPAAAIEVATTSIPLNGVPISEAEAAKPSPEEAVWTQRSIPLQVTLPLSTSVSTASRGADLSMTATFRRFPARSDEQRAELKLSVTFPSIGLSLINDAPEELLYFSAHTLSLSVEQGKALQTVFCKVESAQLDHQRDSAIFPVVIAPSYVPPEERQPLLQLSVTKQRGLRDQSAKAQYAVWSFPTSPSSSSHWTSASKRDWYGPSSATSMSSPNTSRPSRREEEEGQRATSSTKGPLLPSPPSTL